MGNIALRLICIMGACSSMLCSVYFFTQALVMRKMQKRNSTLSSYIKERGFLFARESGDDPCSVRMDSMPEFSQSCGFFVKRGGMH